MKWTHATGLLTTFTLISAGGIWAGCGGDSNGNDGGTNDGGGNDVTTKDTGGGDTGGGDTGTDTGANDSGGGDGGATVDGSVLDCNYYCTNILTVCTGGNNQYLDKPTCMSMCTNGIPNDAGVGATAGDSLACRMYHLNVASTSTANAAIHCPHAGPYGYGMCGTICEDFCHQYFTSACKTDTTTGYANLDACHTYCATAAGADAAAGAPGNAQTTPAMLCREYHLENGVLNDGGGGHCDHAGQSGANVCP
jgi:hypothetical protein